MIIFRFGIALLQRTARCIVMLLFSYSIFLLFLVLHFYVMREFTLGIFSQPAPPVG